MRCPGCALRTWALDLFDHAEQIAALDRRVALGGVLYGFTEGRRAEAAAPLCNACERAVEALTADPFGPAAAPAAALDDVGRLMRVFAPGTRVVAALEIVYAIPQREIDAGARGTVVSTALSRRVTGLSAVVWDDHDGVFPTDNASLDPVPR